MRKIVWLILLFLAIGVGYIYRASILTAVTNFVYRSPCDIPIAYQIGSVDPKFQVSRDVFLQDTQEAAEIWNKAEEKQLFVYNAQGDLPISLVYDGRQTLNNQVNQLNNQVQTQQKNLNPQIQSYEQKAASFKKRMIDLNNQTVYWNNKGGAPEDVYNNIVQQQAALQTEAKQLETEARSLNQSTDQFNQEISHYNTALNKYKDALQTKPEEGIYILNNGKQKIDIYFANGKDELVHTLAHEMGHALGLEHNKNNASIMYPDTTTDITLSPDDLHDLAFVCRKQSILEIIKARIPIVVQNIKQQLGH